MKIPITATNLCYLKTILKSEIRKVTFAEFKHVQESHLKVKDIPYNKFELQEYLNSEEFSNTECELLFAIRSNSVRGLKANTPSIFKNNLSCSLKCNLSESIDDQQHLLACPIIQKALTFTEIEALIKIEYCDIYRTIKKQSKGSFVF